MDFGKKVYAGNFVMMKKSRALSKAEMRQIRDDAGIPEDKRKMPYIRVECAGGGWALEVGINQTMFEALDHLSVARDKTGDWRVPGVEGKNAAAVLAGMFVDTTVVGDAEYQKEKLRVMGEYLDRKTAEKKEKEGKPEGGESDGREEAE